jgi:hypothetical protein
MKLLGGKWSKGDLIALIGVVIGVFAIAVAHRDSLRESYHGRSAEELTAIDSAQVQLDRLRATVNPTHQGKYELVYGEIEGEVKIVHGPAGTTVEFACEEQSCPDATVDEAIAAMIDGPRAAQYPGFQKLNVLERYVSTHRNDTGLQIENNVIPGKAEDYRPLLDHVRGACQLDPHAVDAVLSRLSRLRGLEDSTNGFWVKRDTVNPEVVQRFNRFLHAIGEAAGLSYVDVQTATVARMATMVVSEYLQAYDILGNFQKSCERVKSRSDGPRRVGSAYPFVPRVTVAGG